MQIGHMDDTESIAMPFCMWDFVSVDGQVGRRERHPDIDRVRRRIERPGALADVSHACTAPFAQNDAAENGRRRQKPGQGRQQEPAEGAPAGQPRETRQHDPHFRPAIRSQNEIPVEQNQKDQASGYSVEETGGHA